MHNVFQIDIIVRREALTTTLSVEATPNNAELVLFYSCTRDKVYHTGRCNAEHLRDVLGCSFCCSISDIALGSVDSTAFEYIQYWSCVHCAKWSKVFKTRNKAWGLWQVCICSSDSLKSNYFAHSSTMPSSHIIWLGSLWRNFGLPYKLSVKMAPSLNAHDWRSKIRYFHISPSDSY